MKKILLAFVALVTITAINAQPTGLGFQFGANFSKLTGDLGKIQVMKPGIQAGVNYNIPVGDQFVIQPGLNYLQNGWKNKNDEQKFQITLPFLQLPVLVQFRPEFADGSKVIVGAGPYVSYGVGNVKERYNGKFTSYKWKEAVEFEQKQRVDAGAKLLLGYELAMGVSLNLNADLGLMKATKFGKERHIAFGITAGYRF